jgi:flagellin
MIINHNIAALNTYRQLSNNTTSTQKSLEKLSSGLRINRAGDDAAGLAISEKMRGQIRGLDMASKNAQDGISLIQTAEGALNETHSILQRMRELAVQSANDTNNDNDREELQKEVDQLAQELTRIANNTEFNTKSLLNGAVSSNGVSEATFHIGANSGQNLTLSISAMDAFSLGVARDKVTTSATANGSIISNVSVSDTVGSAVVDGANITFSAADNSGAAPGQVTLGGLTFDFSAGSQLNGYTLELGTVADGTTESATVDTANKKIIINGDFDDTDGSGAFSTSSSIQTAINNALTGAGFTQTSTVSGTATATATGTSSSAISGGADANSSETIITISDGGSNSQTITVQDTDTKVSIGSGAFAGISFDVTDVTNLNSSNDSIDISKTTVTAQAATFVSNQKTADAVAAAGIDISTQTSADAAITVIQNAIEKVSSERSKLGAYQNRLEHTINNLGTASENLTAAESRIRDVDMAKEMMEFTKNNILSQAAQAMLAQANQQPQGVLQLLR